MIDLYGKRSLQYMDPMDFEESRCSFKPSDVSGPGHSQLDLQLAEIFLKRFAG